jgi:hypothetical protein
MFHVVNATGKSLCLATFEVNKPNIILKLRRIYGRDRPMYRNTDGGNI